MRPSRILYDWWGTPAFAVMVLLSAGPALSGSLAMASGLTAFERVRFRPRLRPVNTDTDS